MGNTHRPTTAKQTSFNSRLITAARQNNSLLCVGLDPDPEKLPTHLADEPHPFYHFCAAIVDAVADLACCFKPQIAHFAAQGAEAELEALIAHIHSQHPRLPVILDAKRGDIGSTAACYAKEAFERYDADALTVNPYLGGDSITPYLKYHGKGIFLLCRTSNAGGSDLQSLGIANANGEKLYERVAKLAQEWNTNGQIGLVTGATYPEEISSVRSIVGGNMPLLVPGIGAQGGDIAATLAAGSSQDGMLILNSSRAILYNSAGKDFAQSARQAAIATREQINQERARLACQQ